MSRKKLEKLIECVQKFEELYNMDNKKYKLTGHKHKIWAEIAKKCDFENGNIAKSHWKKLRNSYREALKRQTSKNEQGRGSECQWKFQEQMSFLLNFTINRRMRSNISYNSPEPDNPVVDGIEELSGENLSQSVSRKRSLKDRKIIDILMSNKKQRAVSRHALRQQTFSNPGLYNFFFSMYQTTATFPKDLQIQVKREVFDTISKFEEQTLATQKSPTRQKFEYLDEDIIYDYEYITP